MTTPTHKAMAWDDVRKRLKQVEAGLTDSFEPERRLVDEIYERRARQLAEREESGARHSSVEVLVFNLGQERYAIELSELAEVLPYRGATAIPGVSAALLGVINVRGEIRAVADARRMLDLPAGEAEAAGYVLMLRERGGTIGFKVDTVDEIRQLDRTELMSVGESSATMSGSRFVKALTVDTVSLLDASAVLMHLVPALTRIGDQEVWHG